MARPVGSLVVRIASDTTGLVRGSRRAETRLQNMGRRAQQTARRITALSVALAGVGVAIATNLVREGLRAVDEQAKLARQLDTTIGSVRGLQLAAEEAGVSKEVMGRAAERLNARLGEAQRGTGAAADALERLGLSARDLSGMDIDERFATIADRMRDMGLSSAEAADELRQLGIRQGEIVGLMRQGGDAIRSATRDIEALGLNISEIDARNIEDANDAMGRIGLVMESVRAQAASAVAPAIIEIAERFSDAAEEAEGWGDQARSAAEIAVSGIGSVVEAIGRAIAIVEDHPQMASMGLLGFALFGRKGAAVLGAAGGVMDLIDRAGGDASHQIQDLDGRIRDINHTIDDMIDKTPIADMDFGAVDRLVDLQRHRDVLAENRDELIASEGDARNLSGSLDEISRALEDAESGGDRMSDIFIRAGQAISDSASAVRSGADAPDQLIDGWLVNLERGLEEIEDAEEESQEGRAASRANHIASQLESLRSHLRDEIEAEVHAYQERQELLEQALEQGLITEQEYQEMREALQEQHEERMLELKEQARQRDLDNQDAYISATMSSHMRLMDAMERATASGWGAIGELVTGELESITSSLARNSKAMFQINKAAGIANAIINTHEGITKALAKGDFASAALIAARGFASVAAIQSQSFGGGGGRGSRSGGGDGNGGSVGPSPQRLDVRATFRGDFFSQDQVQSGITDLLDNLQDEARRRGLNLTVTA